MFTGIVEEIGTVRHIAPTSSGSRIEVTATRAVERVSVDDSIAVAGVCLTVIERMTGRSPRTSCPRRSPAPRSGH